MKYLEIPNFNHKSEILKMQSEALDLWDGNYFRLNEHHEKDFRNGIDGSMYACCFYGIHHHITMDYSYYEDEGISFQHANWTEAAQRSPAIKDALQELPIEIYRAVLYICKPKYIQPWHTDSEDKIKGLTDTIHFIIRKPSERAEVVFEDRNRLHYDAFEEGKAYFFNYAYNHCAYNLSNDFRIFFIVAPHQLHGELVDYVAKRQNL